MLWFAGLVAVYVGERIIGSGKARLVASLCGAAAVVVAVAVRSAFAARTTGDARRVHRYLALASGGGVAALGLYGAGLWVAGKTGGANDFAGAAFAVLWPCAIVLSALPMLLLEMAVASVVVQAVELRRLRYSAATGVALACSLVFAFAVNYAGAQTPWRLDLSRQRVARPSEATRNQVKALTQPVEVTAFFPNPNDVGEEALPYFEDLARGTDKVKLATLDHALEPAKARSMAVTGNGNVVLAVGTARETLYIGTDASSAKSRLSSLDGDVRRALTSLARGARVAYFVTGHGEREFDPREDSDPRPTIRTLRQILQEIRYTTKTLGVADGLAKEVPADATLLLLVAPERALLSEEIASLRRYLEGGGRVWVFQDADAPTDLSELIGPFGIKFVADVLANDQNYLRKDYRASDLANIVSIRFGSHASVSTLARFGTRDGVIFVRSGHLEELPKKIVADSKVFLNAFAMPQTWADLNGNFAYDAASEKREGYALVAAAEKPVEGKPDKGMRLLVSADADCASDMTLVYRGNMQFVVDGLKWLAGDEAQIGEVPQPEDVAIQHTRGKDVGWFYGTVVGAPAIALAGGLYALRRRRGGGRRP